MQTLVFQDRGFCNRLVTCSSKKELLIILKDASCLRTEQATSPTLAHDDDNSGKEFLIVKLIVMQLLQTMFFSLPSVQIFS
jgi:hypothetical protein